MSGLTFYGLEADWCDSCIFIRGGEVTMLTEKTSGIWISEVIGTKFYLIESELHTVSAR